MTLSLDFTKEAYLSYLGTWRNQENICSLEENHSYFNTEGYLGYLGFKGTWVWSLLGSKILISLCILPMGLPFLFMGFWGAGMGMGRVSDIFLAGNFRITGRGTWDSDSFLVSNAFSVVGALFLRLASLGYKSNSSHFAWNQPWDTEFITVGRLWMGVYINI